MGAKKRPIRKDGALGAVMNYSRVEKCLMVRTI